MDYKEIINLSKSNEHKWSFVNSYFPIGTAYAIYKSSGMGLYIEIHTKTYLQGFILNRYVRKQKKIKIKNELKY